MRTNDTGITGVRRLAAWPDAREDSVHFSSASNRLQQGVPMLWGRASRSPQASRVQAARHLEPADKETLFLNSSPLASRAQIALRAVAASSNSQHATPLPVTCFALRRVRQLEQADGQPGGLQARGNEAAQLREM